MAADLGATFRRFALSPLLAAYDELSTGKVGEGLTTLASDRASAALRRGIEEVARRAGVRPARVETLLPVLDLEAALERLRASQQAAAIVWSHHRHQLGGFLAGVAEVTAEAERPDAGWFLSRLAGKVMRDRQLSGPLDDLAADVTRWEQLVLRCADLLETAPALRSAFRWRRIRAAIAIAAILGAAATAAALWVRNQRSLDRVRAALAAADPCAAEGIAAADLERAAPEHRRAREERIARCVAARQRAAYETRCADLAGRVEGGRLAPEDAAEDARPPGILGRIAAGALETADLGAEIALPCSDSPAAARLDAALAKAASRSASAWADARAISPRLDGLRRSGALALDDASRQAIADRAEPVAKRAVLMGDAAAIEEAKQRCALGVAVGLTPGTWCAALAVALAPKR